MTPLFLGIAAVFSLVAALTVGIPLWRGSAGKSTGGLIAMVALAILMPLTVLSLYTQVSTYPWDAPDRLEAPSPGSPEQIEMMVGQLAARMSAEPSAEGLTMLGRSYTVLERFSDAADAYQRAWEMTGGKAPELTLNYAEALILADRENLAGTAAELLDAVLADQPDNPKALWYGGLSSIARENTAEAQQRWLHLLNQPDLPEQLRMVVQQQLAAMTDIPAD